MKLNFLFVLIMGLGALQMQAQSDEPKTDVPQSPFTELERMFQEFGFDGKGNQMLLDTMIIKQFGGDAFGNGDMDLMMQEMMQMMEQQFSQFDFNAMPLDELFEGFDFDNLQFEDILIDPNNPNQPEGSEKVAPKKKRKTYKL